MAQNCKQFILVITDYFTRFAMAVPTRNMLTKTMAEALLTFFRNFSITKQLHADQGANFATKMIHSVNHVKKALAWAKVFENPCSAKKVKSEIIVIMTNV